MGILQTDKPTESSCPIQGVRKKKLVTNFSFLIFTYNFFMASTEDCFLLKNSYMISEPRGKVGGLSLCNALVLEVIVMFGHVPVE
jgi:hypothetical protein